MIIATIVAIVAYPAEARMYQWTNAPSGTVQLSGTPPAWYRNGGSGPRIFVFDNGMLVDDTELLVSEEHRQRLRSDAFGALELADPSGPVTAAEDELIGTLEDTTRDGIDASAVTEAFTGEKREAESSEETVEQTVEELRALIDAWDNRRLLEAQTLLQNATGTPE